MRILIAASLLLFGSAAAAQDKGLPSQREIDRAVRRGADFLKKAPSKAGHLSGDCDSLILLTMIHAEVPDTDPDYQRVLKSVVSGPLQHTYTVALTAMALCDLDPTEYQGKIAQCAQFLIDNQCQNGQWSYGRPTDLSKMTFEPPKDKVASGPKAGEAREFARGLKAPEKPKKKIEVRKGAPIGPAAGDNSNSQYAALGLRACFDANVRVPEDVLHMARKWWVDSLWPDESDAAKAGKDAVSSGKSVEKIQGWSYKAPDKDEGHKGPYLAMTAGGVGATVIYEYMLGRDWKKDPITLAAVNWLGKHYAVNQNYYYMYGLERAGILFDTESFGGRNWYWDGAKLLLAHQNANGSWGKDADEEKQTHATCFAVLFLKKATRAIITGGGK